MTTLSINNIKTNIHISLNPNTYMKKQNVVATLGTLALVANLLLPGMAFGQADQTGSANIGCGTLTFNSTPADFNFSPDAVGGIIEVPTSTLDVYSPIDTVAPEADKVLSVRDYRDYNNVDCFNDGFTVTVEVVDDTTDDGLYFASGAAQDENFIPLGSGSEDDFVVVATTGECEDSSATACGLTETGDSTDGFYVHDPATTYETPLAFPTLQFSVGANDGTTNYAARTTYTDETGNNLGTANNTPSAARTLMSVASGEGVFGEVGFVPVYSAQVPALQPTGGYVLNLEYTLN